ncbi:sensor histidine kinase [Celeribacter marinus]|uniref:sensor histidine kinase n=1 Tax=Celeribacter marinus TaxID=1397108 RepID=UPI003F6D9602
MTAHDTHQPIAAKAPAPRRAGLAVVFALAAAVFGAAVYEFAYRAELDQAAARGRSDLALASDRLTTGLQRYRELAVFLADHPTTLTTILEGGNARSQVEAADALLLSMADKTGAKSISIVSRKGYVLADSGDAIRLSSGAKVAFKRALDGALGVAHYVDDAGRRRFVFAAPVFYPGGASRGAVLVSVDVGALEWSWPTDPSATYFTDRAGVVFVANRGELVLRGGIGGDLPIIRARTKSDHEVFDLDAGPYIPARALHLTQSLPVIELTGELLLDLAPVRALARLQSGFATALFLTFGAFAWVAMERRRTLAEANSRLEARVAKRTHALEAANRELKREITEREETEARLKRAQADLVQAGKLSALGEMSAGISHELNQPLMAIRSFAENAQAFLERERAEEAAQNLGRISELARRMGRIIKNLRAFARQENEAITDVDLCAVIDATLEMTGAKIAAAGVTVEWTCAAPVWVRGGDVRLQQVVMNLVSNAVDAMGDSPEKTLMIEVTDGDPVSLVVTDTGPGIADPDKMFDPFYTTKEVGAAQGMGLGLSISYGLIQSFGGKIKGANRPARSGGGAQFTIELTRAGREHEATLQ